LLTFFVLVRVVLMVTVQMPLQMMQVRVEVVVMKNAR
jgi:hypothetical protein